MNDRRAFAVLFLALTCVGLGQAILFAILPPAAREIGLSPFQVSVIFVISATIWMFMSPYWGRRSDVLGRRPVILIGLSGYAASMIFLGAVIELGLRGSAPVLLVYPLMVMSRCIFALFGSGAPPASQAYVADRTTLEERTRGVSLLNAAFGLGQTLGPAAGAVFAVYGVVAPLYFSVVLAVLSTVAIWVFLEEEGLPMAHQERPRSIRFYDPRVWPFFLLAACLQAVRATTTITLAFFLQDSLDLSSETYGATGGCGVCRSRCCRRVHPAYRCPAYTAVITRDDRRRLSGDSLRVVGLHWFERDAWIRCGSSYLGCGFWLDSSRCSRGSLGVGDSGGARRSRRNDELGRRRRQYSRAVGWYCGV